MHKMYTCTFVQLGLERNKIGESNINLHKICFMELNIFNEPWNPPQTISKQMQDIS